MSTLAVTLGRILRPKGAKPQTDDRGEQLLVASQWQLIRWKFFRHKRKFRPLSEVTTIELRIVIFRQTGQITTLNGWYICPCCETQLNILCLLRDEKFFPSCGQSSGRTSKQCKH